MPAFAPTKSALAAAVLCLAPLACAAQEPWPRKNVRFVVAFAPAGPADVVARIVGQALAEKWGKSVIVENRPGAGGNLGTALAARAEPDGYTVLVNTSAFVVNVSLFDKPGYSLADFQPAAYAVTTPNILVRSPALKQSTLTEIIAAAKTENFAYSSAGIGTTTQLAGELIFRILAKIDVRHVPFLGAAPAVNAVMGGQVQLSMLTLSSAGEFIKSGAVKPVAVTTGNRLKELPDTPTVTETGIGKVEASTDIFFFMPAKTPAAIVEKFNTDLNALVAAGALDKAYAAAGLSPVILNPAQAHSHAAGEIDKWAAVIKAAGIKSE